MRRLSASNRAFASRLVVSGGLLLLAAGVVAVSLLALRPFDPVRAEVVQDGLEHPWDIAFASPSGTITVEETLLDGGFGRLRAVVIGPGGELYVSTANGPGDRIIRVTR
jgi:glucose/arabinose dehydrogenase